MVTLPKQHCMSHCFQSTLSNEMSNFIINNNCQSSVGDNPKKYRACLHVCPQHYCCDGFPPLFSILSVSPFFSLLCLFTNRSVWCFYSFPLAHGVPLFLSTCTCVLLPVFVFLSLLLLVLQIVTLLSVCANLSVYWV